MTHPIVQEFLNGENAAAKKLALSMYEGEPCRICGEIITDASKCVYAGYSLGNKARAAHKVCWDKGLPKSQWAYPTDAPRPTYTCANPVAVIDHGG